MSKPDPSRGFERLHNLFEDDLYQRIDATNRANVIGWGLFFTVLQQIQAVRALHRVGACGAAAPNRRAAIEHMITLRWCVDQGDRIGDIYNRKLRSDQIQLANALRAEGTTRQYPADAYEFMVNTVKAAAEIPPDPNERLAKIEHLMDGYDLKMWKTYYQVESRFVHPTPTGVQICIARR